MRKPPQRMDCRRQQHYSEIGPGALYSNAERRMRGESKIL